MLNYLDYTIIVLKQTIEESTATSREKARDHEQYTQEDE